jgi:hypothetical protein
MRSILKFIAIALICINIFLLLSGNYKHALYLFPATAVWTVLLIVIIKFSSDEDEDDNEEEEEEEDENKELAEDEESGY